MRKRLFGAVGVLLVSAGFAFAPPVLTEAPADDRYQPTQDASAYPAFMWTSADYLLWRIKGGRQLPPIVTTGPTTADNPAVLTDPTTVVIYPHDSVDYDAFSGGRLAAGFWFNSCESLGLEISGFLTEKRFNTFRIASDGGGNPVIGVPFLDAQSGTETVNYAAFPGRFAGGVAVSSAARVWGIEGNLLGNAWKTTISPDHRPFAFGDLRIDLLGGFRYLSLTETLDITQPSLVLGGGATDFNGNPVAVGDTVIIQDSFRVRSQFYGGQVGMRSEFTHGPFFVDLLGKIALGDSHEVVGINGATTLLSGSTGLTTSVPGGFFATSTNSGRVERDRFAAVPEIGVNLGYQPLPQLRFFVGYTFLYWSDVVRAGDQFDRTVNVTAVPSSGVFGALTGPARPAVPFRTTDFWVQGVNFGLEFRF
jgi:Putative beta barrel porin-7 (BBP7)